MKLNTKYFGEVDVDEKESLEFVSPIYGFEEILRYVLLTDSAEDSPFSWLQAVDQVDVCFVLTAPEMVSANYAPALGEQTEQALCVSPGQEIVYRLITVVPEDINQATVNLKSPIVINPSTKKAAQVILEDDYPVRMSLLQGEEAEC